MYNIDKIKKEGSNMKKSTILWETICYITLLLCVIGQITVGWYFIFAQSLYLLANILGVIRDIALKLPRANLVRDIVFAGITVGLIVIRFI